MGVGGFIFLFGDPLYAPPANRCIGIVADFAPADVRHVLIEQSGEGAEDSALGLSAQAEKNEIVARENRVHNLRNHGIVIADDAGKNWTPFLIAPPFQ